MCPTTTIQIPFGPLCCPIAAEGFRVSPQNGQAKRLRTKKCLVILANFGTEIVKGLTKYLSLILPVAHRYRNTWLENGGGGGGGGGFKGTSTTSFAQEWSF